MQYTTRQVKVLIGSSRIAGWDSGEGTFSLADQGPVPFPWRECKSSYSIKSYDSISSTKSPDFEIRLYIVTDATEPLDQNVFFCISATKP